MAALLKKRALAEYSQSQTVVEPVPEEQKPKRLRLVKKLVDSVTPGIEAFVNDINALDSTRPTNENFQLLSRIVAALPTLGNDTNQSLLKVKLIQLYHSDKSSALRAKCLSVFQLFKLGKPEAGNILDELIRILSRERGSTLAVLTGLTTVAKLSEIAEDKALNTKLVTLVKKFLQKPDAKLKMRCLEIIGMHSDVSEAGVINETLEFVHSYTHSSDPRVRSVAFAVMLDLHRKGAVLKLAMYKEVIKYLNDDYEMVKLAALKILFALSQAHPNEKVESEAGDMRLIDDAFAQVCTAINDPCIQVRVLAAQLLGKMTQVGPTFLEQTLDKKLMSDMRRKRSAHERKWEKVKAGEWSSGKQWADDAPKERIDADSVSLISGGAAGAFIHGLEDEFMEVRSAAVDSLCELAMRNKAFANQALDFIVDMFNDEIEEVRLKAIDSLGHISNHIILWEDHLDIILSVLEDTSLDIREALHRVLSVSNLLTKACVKLCVEALIDNLRKRPFDKLSIWKCLQGIGQKHAWSVLPLVPNLLSMHPFFDTPETDPEDPIYVSILILVFNAASGCPTMLSMFEEKFVRHYLYLRDTLPLLVPELNLGIESSTMTDTNGDSEESSSRQKLSNSSGKLMLANLVHKLKDSHNLSTSMKLRLSKLILQDVQRLSEVDDDICGVAKLMALYIRAQIVYSNFIIDSNSWRQLSQNSQNDHLKLQIQKFLQLCLKMQYGFSGLSSQEYAIVLQLKLRAILFQLVFIVKGSNASALAICQHLLEQSEKVQKYLEDHKLQPDDFTLALFKVLDTLEDPKPGTLTKLLTPLFEQYPIPLVSFTSSVKMATATIVEPTGDSDTPIEFTAGLVTAIPFDCQLVNLQDREHIRIRIKYPDEQVHLIRPRCNDFRTSLTSPNITRLLTQVIISHKSWTEPCPVSVSVVLDLSGPETNSNSKLAGKSDTMYTLQVSDEKQVLIAPRPPRKGVM